MKGHLRNSFVTLALTAFSLCVAPNAYAALGDRPHDVAVRDGDVVATSLGSNSVSIVLDGTSTAIYQSVGARSWGVCFAGDKAYITMPSAESIAVLDFSGTGAPTVGTSIAVPRGCTEIISDAAGDYLYVANVGASTATNPDDSWQHSILKIDLASPSSIATFPTERQPRALALSPDETRLIVGTVQGAVGGNGIVADYVDGANGFRSTHDGGSVVVHDANSGSALYRFAIGSPVRGIAVLDGSQYATNNSGDYRIYFTHVGEGVQSEDPAHGGTVIPNVVSSIRMNGSHQPQERQDTVFRHDSDHEPAAAAANADLPTVLPERVVALGASTRTGFEAELWITHSASGSLSRAWIDGGTGAIATSGTETVVFPAVDNVAAPTFGFHFSDHTIVYGKIFPQDHARTDDETALANVFRSRPRGLALDSSGPSMWVCTESAGEVVEYDATLSSFPTSAPTPIPVGTKIAAYSSNQNGEGNFFTFGGGFDFREGGATPKVNNISCGTCHVDGHIDGKVRLTVRLGDNKLSGSGENRMVTAVPSMFDANNTEWLFFEGLRTIADRSAVRSGCTYCLANEFFLNTIGFTPTSESSPHVGSVSSLPAAAERGRAWFDDMNCSRCHSGRSKNFLRTRDTRFTNGINAPLNFAEGALSDPTQVFISFIGVDPKTTGDINSLRNLTNVGTRQSDPQATINPAGNTLVNGINTPSLAGVWDNRPYMHDGRYRTLDEVLQHTWLKAGHGDRAARVWAGAGVEDNLFDDEVHVINAGTLPPLRVNSQGALRINSDPVTPHAFQSHRHNDPDGAGTEWTSVKDYLTAQGAYDDVLEFLQSLSSQIDPYPSGGASINNLAVTPGTGSNAVVSWTTPLAVVGRLTATNDVNSDVYEAKTAPGTSHSVTVPLSVAANWTADVSVAYNGVLAEDNIGWSNTTPVITYETDVAQGGQDAIVSWTTDVPTTGHFQWVISDFSEPVQDLYTPFGTSHSVTVPDAAGETWNCLIFADAYGTTSSATPNINFPTVTFSAISVSTNPFCESTISFTTNIPVPCRVDWGPASYPEPIYTEGTSSGTSHSVVVDIEPATLYRVIAWVPEAYGQPFYGGGEKTWKQKICVSGKQGDPVVARAPSLTATPNPFNPRTEIRFTLPTAGHVELEIYDVRGRMLRRLLSEDRNVGEHTVVWNGVDDHGSAVASGVYYLQLRSGRTNLREKLLLVE